MNPSFKNVALEMYRIISEVFYFYTFFYKSTHPDLRSSAKKNFCQI